MSSLPTKAKCVVIGAGIVGNSMVYHLARLGWTDIVQIDKGPLPNPGGSTGHASNFIFLVDHNKEMAQLTLDSLRQYIELDTFFESGGIEVARSAERMQELNRRVTSGKSWGVAGMGTSVTPKSDKASTTALMTAGGEPMAPTSPTPLTPSVLLTQSVVSVDT